jgi:ferric-dicitrate binding protein FerR (iron transport regulator)
MKEVTWVLISKYLAGECTPGEKEQVAAWLQASEANRKYVEQVKLLWESAGEQKVLIEPDLQLAWRKVDRATSNKVSRPLFKHSLQLAASFLLIGALGLLLYFYLNHPKQLVATTGQHERKEIMLPDGSRIWLNENSRVAYPEKFSGDIREVRLIGEAFFEVARKQEQPFQVHTGKSVTSVLGTSFNIRENGGQSIDIHVVSGIVAFYNKEAAAKNIRLQAGETGKLDALSLQPVKGVTRDANFLSWHTLTLHFKNSALQEAIPQLEKFYKKRILLENTALHTCLLTSSFEKRPLVEVLQTLQTIYGLRYQIQGDTVYLRGGGC